MNTKHTPGPWEAIGNLVRSPMHQPQGLPAGVQIADCRDGYFLAHTDEAKANARLIAAAPELLEELKELREFFYGKYGYGNDAEQIKRLNRASAVIAKATGEQP